ncbi:peptide chain release factor 1 [Candidatus Pantoea edessiphila]|uniref:Peptide chain release factor 1 n=1 Tax=Candidatus Pantoea edessiphila TaxID=2044610 RepID=A0A2P5T0N9_9GAMM|nr:peptide chain release factor 1 [Candidatus Pantoea edessiphila]PPI88123.1 peptide chain release factor 1 [Candidatus Pantoea edessiphila]
MKNSIFTKLEGIQHRQKELENLLIDLNVCINKKLFGDLSREYSKLTTITDSFKEWQKIHKNIENLKSLSKDFELQEIAQIELQEAYTKIKILEHKLQLLLLPQDPDDERNCFIEIRAATGGDEAAIFAGDLSRMYIRYAEICNWDVQIINANDSEYGGYKEIIIRVNSKNAYGKLKFESGGHRVQRIPHTESQGRIHTSTCTVAVIPETTKESILKINNNDLKIDSFRSSGAGGQHVNTTDSAVRITHLPTGITVECQHERSQHKNKARALTVLASRIEAIQKAQRHAAEANMRRNLLGTGDRSDRIRTYNFPQGRVTDHRINLTIYRLDEILDGKLASLINPIIQEYKTEQLSSISEKSS